MMRLSRKPGLIPLRSVTLAVLLTTSCAAQRTQQRLPAPPEAPAIPARGDWYGYQLLLADAPGLAAFAIGAGRSNWPLWAGGAALCLASGPVLHRLNGEPSNALSSEYVRVGAPMLGLLVGLGIQSSQATARDSTPRVAAAGTFAGFLIAAVLDDVLNANHRVVTPADGGLALRF